MYQCRSCQQVFSEWLEACPSCSAFRSLQRMAVEKPAVDASRPPRRTRGKLITSRELAKADLISMPLSQDWRDFFGNMPPQFSILVYGQAGGGKSSFLLCFALQLARHGPVMYAASEEGHSNSLIEKLNKFEILSDRILISSAISAEELVADLDHAPHTRFLIIDSIAALPISVAALSEIVEARRLGVAFSLHATKDGSYRGATSWGHATDVICRVSQGVIELEKNRFGPLSKGHLNIKFDPAREVQL